MAEASSNQHERLVDENTRLRAALDEIRTMMEPYLNREGPPPADRPFERVIVHDVRNVVNELGLLRALVPKDEFN